MGVIQLKSDEASVPEVRLDYDLEGLSCHMVLTMDALGPSE
jgi:hypothetical protein